LPYSFGTLGQEETIMRWGAVP